MRRNIGFALGAIVVILICAVVGFGAYRLVQYAQAKEAAPVTTESAETSEASNDQKVASTPEPAAKVTEVVSNTEKVDDFVYAGGDFLAVEVAALEDGWNRLVQPGNSHPPDYPEYCSWAFQFKLQLSGNLQAQFPHCIELRMTGSGTAILTVRPDSTGYATSDTLGTGLAWWPTGNNGTYQVSRDGGKTWTDPIPLTTGPEGVNFASDGGEVQIKFVLENGFAAAPLGEIRNHILPRY